MNQASAGVSYVRGLTSSYCSQSAQGVKKSVTGYLRQTITNYIQDFAGKYASTYSNPKDYAKTSVCFLLIALGIYYRQHKLLGEIKNYQIKQMQSIAILSGQFPLLEKKLFESLHQASHTTTLYHRLMKYSSCFVLCGLSTVAVGRLSLHGYAATCHKDDR